MIKAITKKKGQKGFTLIELMIVIAIIGILAAIAVPQFLAYRTKSMFASLISDARTAHTAVVAWKAENPSSTQYQAEKIVFPTAGVHYPAAKASAGNTIDIDTTGKVTVTNSDTNMTQAKIIMTESGEFTGSKNINNKDWP